MANSIDLGAIVLGAMVGYGLRKEIKSTSNIAKNALLAAVAGAAVTAAQQGQAKVEQAEGGKKE